MTVFRVQHNQNYTTINNFICEYQRLFWKAKDIWLYAFSRKGNWSFNLIDLHNRSKYSRGPINSGLKGLEKYGCLSRSQTRTKDGKFNDTEWTFVCAIPSALEEVK